MKGDGKLQGASLGPYGAGSIERTAELELEAVYLQADRIRSGSGSQWVDARFFVLALHHLSRTATLTKSHMQMGEPMRSALRAYRIAIPDLERFRGAIEHSAEWRAGVGRGPGRRSPDQMRASIGILGSPAQEIHLTDADDVFYTVPVLAAVEAAYSLALATVEAHSSCTACASADNLVRRVSLEEPRHWPRQIPGTVRFRVPRFVEPGTSLLVDDVSYRVIGTEVTEVEGAVHHIVTAAPSSP